VVLIGVAAAWPGGIKADRSMARKPHGLIFSMPVVPEAANMNRHQLHRSAACGADRAPNRSNWRRYSHH